MEACSKQIAHEAEHGVQNRVFLQPRWAAKTGVGGA